MSPRLAPLALIAGLIAVSTGCSTTRPELDQANNGVALTASLQRELDAFRRAQASIASSRVESIRLQRQRLATYSVDAALDERILKAAGNTDSAKLYTTLKELAEARAAEDRDRLLELQSIDDQLGKIVAALPDNTAKLQATQKALAMLGKELSQKDRIAMGLAFAGEIKTTVEENREKIEQAGTASPGSSAQLPDEPAK